MRDWIERPVVLDGGMYVDREATVCFRVIDEDWLKIETFTIDGCVYHATIIERQIGVAAMAALVDEVEEWWIDEGRAKWRDDSEADYADARYHMERDYA